jgi:hypothetical protein
LRQFVSVVRDIPMIVEDTQADPGKLKKAVVRSCSYNETQTKVRT